MMTCKSLSTWGLCLMTAALTLAVGCAQSSLPSSTPEEVFETAKKAAEDKDFKRFAQCMTENSQNHLAATMLFVAGMADAPAPPAMSAQMQEGREKMKAAAEKLKAVLDKHGVEPVNMMEMLPKMLTSGDPNKLMAELAEPIKDKPAFIGEAFAVVEGLQDDAQAVPVFDNLTLKNVEIDGDTAKGEVTNSQAGVAMKQNWNFKKTPEGWRIDMFAAQPKVDMPKMEMPEMPDMPDMPSMPGMPGMPGDK